jgi:hypothetical protein
MKKIPVNIDDITLAMQHCDRDIFEEYLDTITGDVINIPSEIWSALEEEYPMDADDLSDWEKELVPVAKAIMEDEGGRYLCIPVAESHDAYRQMEDFTANVKNPLLQELLFVALDGPGAFRRFKDVLANHPEERERWFQWQQDYERRMVVEWLEDEGFEVEEKSS